MSPPRFWAVVPAAGAGRRMGAEVPKQYLSLLGQPILQHTLERLLAAEVFAGIAVALSEGDPYWPKLKWAGDARIRLAQGGRERADSVLSALAALRDSAEPGDWVLVHDAARACVTPADIRKLIAGVGDDPVGGILAVPVSDTLKSVADGHIDATVDRERIWRAQTPQMFRYSALRDALDDAARENAVVTDEASAMERLGLRPLIVEGRPDNIKITRPEDLPLAEFYLERQRCFE